jgi:hypothetical protein
MYIRVVFLVGDLAFPGFALDFLSLPLKIPSQVVQLIEKLARTCTRQPEGSFGIQAQLLRICHATSPLHQAGSACTIISLGRRPLQHSSLLNLLAVADYE